MNGTAKVIGWNAGFFLPAKWTLFWTLNTASFPKMKENQVFFSCCNPNTAQKQLKGEWVCFDLGFASGVLFRQSRWLPGGWSVQVGPLTCFCSQDSSLFLSSVVRRPFSLWVVLSLSSLLAPHRHSQRCVSWMPLIQSNWQSKFPITVYNLIKLECPFYPFSENFDTHDVIWFSPMHHLVGWMTVVGRKATL